MPKEAKAKLYVAVNYLWLLIKLCASLCPLWLIKIDKVLAKHYGFTEEELDFIINYDIKYRMGTELEGDNE